ncbi:hypothetical protein VINI7043_05148 [Vibrio nigripulchritudo ATCC 27043]|nr:hypothetical protein VINI7043_05148 [Vibrio nigripulchritudo ATCC 27043]
MSLLGYFSVGAVVLKASPVKLVFRQLYHKTRRLKKIMENCKSHKMIPE